MSATRIGTLRSIHRYPVKSMLGHTLDSALLGELGLPGDRVWGVRDEARGDFMTGKRVAALMGCRARLPGDDPEGVPEIAPPGGDWFRADAPDAAKRLSEALGREVTLWPIDPAAQGAAPTEPDASFDREADERAMMARAPDEPMPDFSELPSDLLAFMARPERPYFDAFPLLLLSEQSIATMARAAEGSRMDLRRFRPSLLIDVPEAGDLPEQAWLDRRLQIGEALVAVRMTCARCVMTTHGFADLPKDPQIMRQLVRRAEGNLGVYAIIEEPGRIAVGDGIELVD